MGFYKAIKRDRISYYIRTETEGYFTIYCSAKASNKAICIHINNILLRGKCKNVCNFMLLYVEINSEEYTTLITMVI